MKLKALAASLVLGTMAAGSALAATSNPAAPVVGAAASTTGTTGTVDVTLTIADIIHISGLSTIALGTYTGDSLNMTGNTPFCVFRNGTGNYSLTLTSANQVAGAHFLKAGANTIPYAIYYTDALGTIANIPSSAVAVNRAAGAVATSPTCSAHASDNGALDVTVTGADLDAAAPGNYLDTVTLLVKAL